MIKVILKIQELMLKLSHPLTFSLQINSLQKPLTTSRPPTPQNGGAC